MGEGKPGRGDACLAAATLPRPGPRVSRSSIRRDSRVRDSGSSSRACPDRGMSTQRPRRTLCVKRSDVVCPFPPVRATRGRLVPQLLLPPASGLIVRRAISFQWIPSAHNPARPAVTRPGVRSMAPRVREGRPAGVARTKRAGKSVELDTANDRPSDAFHKEPAHEVEELRRESLLRLRRRRVASQVDPREDRPADRAVAQLDASGRGCGGGEMSTVETARPCPVKSVLNGPVPATKVSRHQSPSLRQRDCEPRGDCLLKLLDAGDGFGRVGLGRLRLRGGAADLFVQPLHQLESLGPFSRDLECQG